MDHSFRSNCVLCDSKKLKVVLNFKKTPLANSYQKSPNKKNKLYNLSTVLCGTCGHLQLKELIKPEIMFRDYLYVSGTSKVLISHFKNYANKIIKKFNLKKKDKILDIACNDGTFLENFIKKKFQNVVGVEPALNLKKINIKKKIKINSFFFGYKKSFILKKKYKSFKLITANNVCAHVPNLKDFFKGIKNILSKDGHMIFEVSYLYDVIKKLSFDTIYHEHMSYHSVKPLISFFHSLNLELIDCEKVKAQGGSIRVYISHRNSFKVKKKKILSLIKNEKKLGLFNTTIYKKYYSRINYQKNKLNKILHEFKKKNLKIYGFGAPAKLTTFSYVFELKKKLFEAIVDDNELKQNLYTPGKKIPIISYKKLVKKNFDIILIFAWNFSSSIISRLRKDFKNSQKKLIVPFPKVKVIKC